MKAWASSLALALALIGCGESGEIEQAGATQALARGPRSVLLLTLDTARRDHMGFHGRTPSPTPNLDLLAEGAIVFEDAYTPAPTTLPAHASLMTGLYPVRHGLRSNGRNSLSEGATTLAEGLSDAGWDTAAVVSAFVLDGTFGLGQGFDAYASPPNRVGAGGLRRIEWKADQVVEKALALLEDLEPPFFLWVHVFDPHRPYEAPPMALSTDGAAAGVEASYDGEIQFADAAIGDLFAGLEKKGFWKDGLVVLAADHGEGLADGIESTHAYFVHDTTVRIPLVIKHPGLAPARVTAQVSLVDVLPTVLDLVGLAPSAASIDGISLVPWMVDPDLAEPGRPLLIESHHPFEFHGWSPFEGIVRGPLKLIWSRSPAFYDRSDDPGEKIDLFPGASASGDRRLAELKRDLDRLYGGRTAFAAGDAVGGSDVMQALGDLGYVDTGGGAGGERPAFSELADTRLKGPVIEGMLALTPAVEEGRLPDAVQILGELIVLEPTSVSLRATKGKILLAMGPEWVDEAEWVLQEALQLRPGHSEALWQFARCAGARSQTLRQRASESRTRADFVTWRQAVGVWAERLEAVRARDHDRIEASANLALLGKEAGDLARRAGRADDARESYAAARSLVEDILEHLSTDNPERLRFETLLAELSVPEAGSGG